MTIQPFVVSSLLLDESNPRFAAPVDSQRQAINSVIADSPSKLVKLARDIVVEGTTNPTELPVVVNEDDDMIVIEGNRRVAALKLLRNPELADDPDLQRQFKSLAKDGVGPDDLMCFEAESRDAARHWLELRHTGENEGVGVVGWEAWQTNNFRRRRGTQADRAMIFCAAVIVEFPHDAALLADVETVRRDRLTTLGRLVSDPAIRHEFGFDFTPDGLVFHYETDELIDGIRKIFSDLAGPVGVTDIKSKEQREDYVKNAAGVLPRRSTRLGTARRPGEAPATPASPSGPPPSGASPGTAAPGTAGGGLVLPAPPVTTAGRTRRTMPTEEKVIFHGVRLKSVELRTSKLLSQAQSLHIESLPAVAAVMVRVVVELVVSEVVTKYGWATEGDTLKVKIGAALRGLDPDIDNPRKRDKSLEAAWLASQAPTATIVESMHSFVHGVMAHPTAGEVRALSGTFRSMIERLDQYIADNP